MIRCKYHCHLLALFCRTSDIGYWATYATDDCDCCFSNYCLCLSILLSNWQRIYNFSSDTCGGEINTGEVTTISSPSYPFSYPSSERCEWDVNVGEGRAILELTALSTESCCDYLYVSCDINFICSWIIVFFLCEICLPSYPRSFIG